MCDVVLLKEVLRSIGQMAGATAALEPLGGGA